MKSTHTLFKKATILSQVYEKKQVIWNLSSYKQSSKFFSPEKVHALWKVSKLFEIEKENKRCNSRERYKNLQRNERKILVDYREHSRKCWKFYHIFNVSSHYHIPSFIYRYFSCIYNNLFFDGIDTFLPFKLNGLQNKRRSLKIEKIVIIKAVTKKIPFFGYLKFALLLSMPFYCYTSCQPSELTIAAFRDTIKKRHYPSCQFWKLNRSFASYLKK